MLIEEIKVHNKNIAKTERWSELNRVVLKQQGVELKQQGDVLKRQSDVLERQEKRKKRIKKNLNISRYLDGE